MNSPRTITTIGIIDKAIFFKVNKNLEIIKARIDKLKADEGV